MVRPSPLRRPVAVALAAVVALLAGGCGVTDITFEESAVGPRRAEHRVDLPDADPDEVVEIALEDLGGFWADEYPQLYGGRFEPLAGGFVPYGPGTPVPQCGEDRIVYDDVAGNALYCPVDDLIAWDRVALVPDLAERFGPLTVGIVMAHEYAHAVQARADVRGEPVTIELQADCFAGAWVGDVADRIDVFATTGGALDQAIAGFLELRDTVGVGALDPHAHGSGFDRVSAFQDGYDSGGEVCVAYESDPPPVVAIPFLGLEDFERGGNLPLDQLLPLLLANLESFFAEEVRDDGGRWDELDGLVPVDPATDRVRCGDETLEGEDLELSSFYCVPDDTIYIDNDELVPALDQIGDFAFGGEVARQYAFAAQAKSGVLDGGGDTELHADCAAGAFSAAVFEGTIAVERDFALALSPGDLDEIIIAFLAFGTGDASAFQRTAAFRTGFLDGYDACEGLL